MNDLNDLVRPEFEARMVASTPAALRFFLQQSAEVDWIRKNCECGTLSDQRMRRFVAALLREHASEERFPHQAALACLAVAMEPFDFLFAREYIRSLASLKTGRFTMASRVAQLVVERRRLMQVLSEEGDFEWAEPGGQLARSGTADIELVSAECPGIGIAPNYSRSNEVFEVA